MALIACDTSVRVRDGLRRDLFTLIDPRSRIAFAWAAPTCSPRHSALALRTLVDLLPTPTRAVLSDNGAECMKDLDAVCQQRPITHDRTCPRSPEMHAHCERFNRALADWLVCYNTERPHRSLAMQSPLQSLLHHHPECHRLWTHTEV